MLKMISKRCYFSHNSLYKFFSEKYDLDALSVDKCLEYLLCTNPKRKIFYLMDVYLSVYQKLIHLVRQFFLKSIFKLVTNWEIHSENESPITRKVVP